MKELGEDPAEFQMLRESLRKAFQPQDGFEEMLVTDMAEIRWRRQRLLRAEVGLLATQKKEFQIQRELDVSDVREGPARAAAEAYLASFGLVGQERSYRNCAEILSALANFKEFIEAEGFQKDNRVFLECVYGREGTLRSRHMTSQFDKCCNHPQAGRSAEQEVQRKAFVRELDEQIGRYGRLFELYQARDFETTQSMQDAQLVLTQEDLDKIMRYEAALERQFERKLQQLVAWRRASREPAAVEGAAPWAGPPEESK